MKITYDEDTTSIFCRFLNQQDTTDKTCSIEYVQCQRRLISIPKQLNATDTGIPNTFQINIDDSDEATYCYRVKASNSSYTVHVDGTLNLGKTLKLYNNKRTLYTLITGDSSRASNINTDAVIGGVVGGVLSIIILAVIVIIFICLRGKRYK